MIYYLELYHHQVMYVESNQPDTHMWDILGHYIKIKILITKVFLNYPY